MSKSILAAIGGSLAVASIAMAQPAPAPATPPAAPAGPQILRGAVTAVGNDKITLKTREGKIVDVNLTKDWTVRVTKPITAADIQAGSFIGTAEMPQSDGVGRSLEVHVFPPA